MCPKPKVCLRQMPRELVIEVSFLELFSKVQDSTIIG
jgi:hypothetical protein